MASIANYRISLNIIICMGFKHHIYDNLWKKEKIFGKQKLKTDIT